MSQQGASLGYRGMDPTRVRVDGHVVLSADVMVDVISQNTSRWVPQSASVLDKSLGGATVACVLVNGFEVAAKVRGATFVLDNAKQVGVEKSAIPYLAALEGAGTAGLVLGLAGYRRVGVAAAVGLDLFFLAAVAAHVRARVLHNIAFPMAFLALAGGATGFFGRAVNR